MPDPFPHHPSSRRTHFAALDALRGIAALSVCWFHFTNAQFHERFPVYRATGQYGYLGVQIFFVISGFIIPWSMLRANYRITYFFRFLLKRLVRLHPPYIFSILFVIAGLKLSSLAPGHSPYRIPWMLVLEHIGYLNPFLGTPWFQMSYWSLAVEFQYYLFVGMAFTLLIRKGLIGTLLTSILFVAPAVIVGQRNEFLPHHLPLFLMGVIAFRLRCLNDSRIDLALGMLSAVAAACYVDGSLQAAVGVTSAAVILFVNSSITLLDFFGRISYSLYLVHVFIGNIVFGLASRRPGDLGILKWVLPWVALGLTIAIAYFVYSFVEAPSKRWSARINYNRPHRHTEVPPQDLTAVSHSSVNVDDTPKMLVPPESPFG